MNVEQMCSGETACNVVIGVVIGGGLYFSNP